MSSASFLDLVIRIGLADALLRSTLRMVAVLACAMVAEARTPDDMVAVLIVLSARCKRESGSLMAFEFVGKRREDSGHREKEADESMLPEGVESSRGPCSSRDETS